MSTIRSTSPLPPSSRYTAINLPSAPLLWPHWHCGFCGSLHRIRVCVRVRFGLVLCVFGQCHLISRSQRDSLSPSVCISLSLSLSLSTCLSLSPFVCLFCLLSGCHLVFEMKCKELDMGYSRNLLCGFSLSPPSCLSSFVCPLAEWVDNRLTFSHQMRAGNLLNYLCDS